MRLLDITMDLGPGATLAHLEAIVMGVRVATDVARDAEEHRARRAASERMKYPSDDELRRALETLPEGGEQSPWDRAKRQLDARHLIWEEFLPPDLWYEYFYRLRRRPKGEPMERSSFLSALSAAGYDRVVGPAPILGLPGLDVVDPVLYDALVADEVARALPEAIGVRVLRYENPFLATIFGKRTAEKAVSKTGEVLEVAATLGSRRTIAKAEATVQQATTDDRITESHLDVAIKNEMLREARLRNERLVLENAALRDALGAEQQRRRLIEQALRSGKPDIADVIRSLEPGDAHALGQIGYLALERKEYSEPDGPEAAAENGE